MTFEEKLLRDRILGLGENPDDPEVMARYKKEFDQESEEEENDDVNKVCDSQQIHSMFVSLYQTMQALDPMIVKPAQYQNITLGGLLVKQTVAFCLNLVGADGVLTNEEAEFLNEVLENNYSSAEYAQIYREYDQQSFLQGNAALRNFFVPQVYYAALVADNGLYQGEEICRAAVLKFFLELGKAIVSVDGQVTEEEAKALQMFGSALKTINDENTKGYLFVGNSGGVRI